MKIMLKNKTHPRFVVLPLFVLLLATAVVADSSMEELHNILEKRAGFSFSKRASDAITNDLGLCVSRGFTDLADDFLLQLGIHYGLVQKNPERAIETFRRLVAEYPQGTICYESGLLMLYVNLSPKAREEGEEETGKVYLTQLPYSSADYATLWIASLLMTHNRERESVEVLERLVELKRQQGAFSNDCASVRRVLGLNSGDVLPSVVSKMMELDADKMALRMLVKAYVKLGEQANAKCVYDLAKERFPEACPWAEEELKLLDEENIKELEQKLENVKTNAVF